MFILEFMIRTHNASHQQMTPNVLSIKRMKCGKELSRSHCVCVCVCLQNKLRLSNYTVEKNIYVDMNFAGQTPGRNVEKQIPLIWSLMPMSSME